MPSIHINIEQIQIFILILLRISAIIIFLPVFDSKNIPVIFKVGLVLSMTALVMPLTHIKPTDYLNELHLFLAAAGGEVLLGAAVGMLVKFFFGALQLAGQVAGYQMGLGIANVIDPLSNEQVPFLGQLKTLTALMVFLALDAHHLLIRAVIESFRMAPPLDFFIGSSVINQIVRVSSVMFVTALKIGAPVMASLLLTSIALGIAARTVPQMNVFIVAFPLKILVGLIFLGFAVPYLVVFLGAAFKSLAGDMLILFKAASSLS